MRALARIVACCLFTALPSVAGAQTYPDSGHLYLTTVGV